MPNEKTEPRSIPIKLQIGTAHNSLWRIFPSALTIDVDLETATDHNSRQPTFIWSARIGFACKQTIVVKGGTLAEIVERSILRRHHMEDLSQATQLAAIRGVVASRVSRN